MRRGHFITLEGGEGVGKSTQSRLLAEDLRGHGLPVLLTREPGGTAGAEAIRSLLLDPARPDDAGGWSPPAEALLFAAARADHVAKIIRPALERGEWVVCDRFLDSSRAYQGGEGGMSDDDLLALHRIGSQGLMPNATLLIEVDPATAAARLTARDAGRADRIGGRDAAFHAAVAERLAMIAAAEAHRVIRIDGNGAANEVRRRIRQALERLWTLSTV